MTIQVNDRKRIDKAKIIEAAMSFPMYDVLKKYSQEQSLPIEVAREHEREIKRFLALCVINHNIHYMMRGPMDEIWHTFILFTKKYHEFCNLIAGHYIHHFPSVQDEKQADIKNYVQFLHDYKVLFGEKPPPQYWPRSQKRSGDTAMCERCATGLCGSVCNIVVSH